MRPRRLAVIGVLAGLSLVGGETRPEGRQPEKRGASPIVVLEPADALGDVATADGDVWLDDRGGDRVLRLDADGGRVIAALPVHGRVALAAGAGAVWALQSGGELGAGLRGPLLRIDPRTNRVRARIPLGTAGRRAVLGFGVRVLGRDVWIWGPRHILRVDTRADRVTTRLPVGEAHGELTGFAPSRRQLVAGTADGHVLRFDPRTGRSLGALRTGLRRPSPKAVKGDRVLYTASGSVGVLDMGSGRVRWRRPLGFRAGATLAPGGLVWTHSAAADEPGDRLTALRLENGRVVTSGLLPAFGSAGIAVRAGRVWIPTAGGQLLALTPFAA